MPHFSRRGAWILFAVVLLALTASRLPYLPLYYPAPSRDAGMFLYMGQQLINGGQPYLTFWDHKSPVIFLMGALSAFLGNGTRWGLFAIDCIGLFAGFFLLWRALRVHLQHGFIAIALILAALSLPPVLRDGGVIEGFALMAQCIALWALSRIALNGKVLPHALLIGVLMGVCFWMRPNTIGTFVAAGLVMLLYLPSRWRAIFAVTAGFAAVTAGVFLWMSSQNAFDEMLEAAFAYNFVYSSAGVGNRLDTALFAAGLLLPSGVILWGVLAWFIYGAHLLLRRVSGRENLILTAALIAFPLEIALSLISNRTIEHYFVMWLVPLTVLTAFAFRGLFNLAAPRLNRSAVFAVGGLAMLCAALPLVEIGRQTIAALENRRGTDYRRTVYAAVEYVDQYTQAVTVDEMLIWGADGASVHYMTGIPAVSRFFFHMPLLAPNYGERYFAEFNMTLQADPPALILDSASPYEGSLVPPIAADFFARWQENNPTVHVPAEFTMLYDFIQQHYTFDTRIQGQWRAFVRNSELAVNP